MFGRSFGSDCIRRGWLALAIGLIPVGAIAAPAPAVAAVQSQTITATVTPATQGQTAFGGVSLSLAEDETYTSSFSPTLSQMVFHLDNDLAIDTTGLPQCPSASIANQTRANAIAACPGSVVGSGSSQMYPGPQQGVITVFNGQPSGGEPTVLLHDSINNDAVDFVIAGVVAPSTMGGDFGVQITFHIPPTGLATTHLDFTLNNLAPAVGHHYLSARCNDSDHLWNFAGDFSFSDASAQSATAAQTCQVLSGASTGQQAAALKKCKKKHSAKRRRKCRKRANRLPD
jgi:hypothetical protein